MDNLKRIITMHDYSDAGLARLFAKLDALHDLAREGYLSEATELTPSQIIGWLEDIIFAAEETIRELDARGAWRDIFSMADESDARQKDIHSLYSD